MAKKKFELQTFKDLKLKYKIYVVLLIIMAIILVLSGTVLLAGMTKEIPATNSNPEGSTKFVPGKIIGGLLCFALGSLSGYWAYYLMTDSRNAMTCNANFWNITSCVSFPNPNEESEVELNITLCKAQTKAEYEKYAGFYAKSNTVTLTNVDVYYLSGDTTSVNATNGTSVLYVKKKQSKDDTDITVKGGGTCPTPTSSSSCSPGLSRTPNVSPATPCYSPCPSSQVRYGSNAQCESDVSTFKITNVSLTQNGITLSTTGTTPRIVYLYPYSDPARTQLVTDSAIIFFPPFTSITAAPPSMTVGTTYYYKYRVNELNDPLKTVSI